MAWEMDGVGGVEARGDGAGGCTKGAAEYDRRFTETSLHRSDTSRRIRNKRRRFDSRGGEEMARVARAVPGERALPTAEDGGAEARPSEQGRTQAEVCGYVRSYT